VFLGCGCNATFKGKERSVEIGVGVKPPTNNVISVTYTKIGISISQNPATQAPELVLGYQRATYHRIPLLGSNMTVAPVRSGIVTTQNGMKTVIREEFETGNTNAIISR
jgi:hypothetical protein